jgi:hypothetical protein
MGEMGKGDIYRAWKRGGCVFHVASIIMMLIVIGRDICIGVLWRRDGEDGAAESGGGEEEGCETHGS